MTNGTLIFTIICGIILIYFVYHLSIYILEAKSRNNQIEEKQNSMLKANREFIVIKTDLINEISKQYNLEDAEKVSKGIIWIGMPNTLLLISRGVPEEVKDTYYKENVIEKWYYEGYRTRLNTYKYRFEIIVENYKVAGWKDL